MGPVVAVVVDAEVDAVVAERVEDGPHLGAVLEALLLDLLGGGGVDGLAGEAVHPEAHGEHLADGGRRLGVAGAAALQPVPKGLLDGGRGHHHAPALPVHHVGRHVLERDEEPQHVSLCLRHGSGPVVTPPSQPPREVGYACSWSNASVAFRRTARGRRAKEADGKGGRG